MPKQTYFITKIKLRLQSIVVGNSVNVRVEHIGIASLNLTSIRRNLIFVSVSKKCSFIFIFLMTIKLNFFVTPIWLVLMFCQMVCTCWILILFLLFNAKQTFMGLSIIFVTLKGYKYLITFTDDFSWYGWIYLLREMSKSLNSFKELKTHTNWKWNLMLRLNVFILIEVVNCMGGMMKHASRKWYLKFDNVVTSLSFKENIVDRCIYLSLVGANSSLLFSMLMIFFWLVMILISCTRLNKY